jgi:ferric-chelate reductase
MSLPQLFLALLVCTLNTIHSTKANRIRYQADHVYALNTVYLMCAVIGIFTISNLLVRLAPDRVKRTRPWRMFTSGSRYLSYRGYRLPTLRYWSPALGVIILGILGAAFLFGEFSNDIWE